MAEVLKGLEAKITKKRRIGGFNAVLGRNKVDKIRGRLKSAQLMLILTNQMYFREGALIARAKT